MSLGSAPFRTGSLDTTFNYSKLIFSLKPITVLQFFIKIWRNLLQILLTEWAPPSKFCLYYIPYFFIFLPKNYKSFGKYYVFTNLSIDFQISINCNVYFWKITIKVGLCQIVKFHSDQRKSDLSKISWNWSSEKSGDKLLCSKA